MSDLTIWVELEHLPTRKRAVEFTGTNGADVAALFDNADLVDWDGWQLSVKNNGGEWIASPGDYVVKDGPKVYPLPPDERARQYRIVGDWS